MSSFAKGSRASRSPLLSPVLLNDSGVNIPSAKAGTAFKLLNLDVESVYTNLMIGLLYEPLGVRTVTTRTFPSRAGCTSVIRARGHLVGLVGSSRRHTMSPTCTFCAGFFHFDSRFRVVRYSCDYRVQKWLVSLWHRFLAQIPQIVMG